MRSIQVIGPDGLPETQGVDGLVVNDERTVYDDSTSDRCNDCHAAHLWR
jgi:hypothetical protein